MPRGQLVTATLAVLALAGCGEGLRPADVDGVYVLDPPSSRLYDTESGTVALTLAGTVERRVTCIIAARETLFVTRGTYKFGRRERSTFG